MREAEKILNDNGTLAIFPEGGSHGRMLRPPRPGTAFLALRTNARVLPIGLIGMDQVFESLSKFKRQKVRIKIGKPIGPFKIRAKGRKRREAREEIGDLIMQSIADLIPPEKHGYLSDDPEIQAQVVEYPWDGKREGEVEAMNRR